MGERFEDPRLERLAGSVIGLMAGDALGMPVEGWSWPMIENRYGWLSEMRPGRFPAGWYTDDFQMALGLLESLVASKGFDPAACAAQWLANYDPRRGYGARLHGVMSRLAAGEPWSEVGTDSFGNGSAMRVGPLGVFYADDVETLIETAAESARITHRHPRAVAGAVIQAGAVGLALRLGLADERVDRDDFIETLAGYAESIDSESASRLRAVAAIAPARPVELRLAITRLFRCDVTAIEAVPPAIASFLLTDDLPGAVSLAVNLGGDADTLAAMTGAVAGAYYGAGAIPGQWWDALENGPGSGRDYAIDLCRRAGELIAWPQRG